MCGIAGYSLAGDSPVNRTLAAQALLAAIAERGADAAGYAHRAPGSPVVVHKRRSGAGALLQHVSVPAGATELLAHVRDYTKGHPRIGGNNHPVRHGAVVGVHNGIIFNDEELLAEHGIEREHPRMTVDSEVIFALAERYGNAPTALERLRGSLAAAWLDERSPEVLFLARGVGRPVWLGRSGRETFFASTAAALRVVGSTLGTTLELEELGEGTLLALAAGCEQARTRFVPDRAFEEEPLPSVRAPHEGARCLSLLATLAAAA